jgi:hypothetical protein
MLDLWGKCLWVVGLGVSKTKVYGTQRNNLFVILKKGDYKMEQPQNNRAKASNAAIEHRIQSRWDASTESEALALIGLMKDHPSMTWRDMITKAEAHDIRHWQLLLQNSNDIYESIAEAIADNDGLVNVDDIENEKG